MPLLCSVSDIKYTVAIINEDDYDQILNSVGENHSYHSVCGFIRDGKLWYNGVEVLEGHWSHEIIRAYPVDTFMIIIEGSPNGIDGFLEQYIAMEQDWYHQHELYDIWQTSVGYVAVC